MPGRATPPMPESSPPQWAISALTSVPLVARAGMHHQPRRLVDDEEVLVLEDDVERDVLAGDIELLRRRHDDPHMRAGFRLGAGIAHRTPVHVNQPVADQLLQARPRQSEALRLAARREHAIEPQAVFVRAERKFMRGAGRCRGNSVAQMKRPRRNLRGH